LLSDFYNFDFSKLNYHGKSLQIVHCRLNQLPDFGTSSSGKVKLEVNGSPVRFESTGKMNGWVFEVGYKMPLNAVFKKQSNLTKKKL
jgi:hypothetical protein